MEVVEHVFHFISSKCFIIPTYYIPHYPKIKGGVACHLYPLQGSMVFLRLLDVESVLGAFS